MLHQNFVSPALERETLINLRGKLRAFIEKLSRVNGIKRTFELVLDFLYSSCLDQHIERSGPESSNQFFFPKDGNLDTGNAAVEPFAPIILALETALHQTLEYPKYFGPMPEERIKSIVKTYMVDCGLLSQIRIDGLDVAIGCGTVQLYDAVVRSVIHRPGDVILAHAPTYGFFVPQPERMGGKLELLYQHADDEKPLQPSDILNHILYHNRQLHDQWVSELTWRIEQSLVHFQSLKVIGALPGVKVQQGLKDQLGSIDPGALPSEKDYAIEAAFRHSLGPLLLSPSQLEWSEYIKRIICPPRIVSFFFVNPDVRGVLYSADEVRELAQVFAHADISVIEDLAFHHLMPSSFEKVRSIGDFHDKVYTLIGLSKPLAIANLRTGILVGNKELLRQPVRIVENTIGFPGLVATTVVSAALSRANADQRLLYLKLNSEIYRSRRNLALALLSGIRKVLMDASDLRKCEETVKKALADFLERKRADGYEIVCGSGNIASEELVRQFAEEGLSRWFRICATGKCGFFVIVDCSPLIECKEEIGVPELCNASCVAALLFELFGIRLIPQQGMGMISSDSPQLLRLSFSTEEFVLVQAVFTIYIGLRQLKEIKLSNYT